MYKVVGADRREYGPVSREAILEWIAQGRANAQTIAKFEDGAWKPLGTFDEFREALSAAPAPPPTIAQTSSSTYSSAEPPPFSGVGSRSQTNIPAVVGIVAPIVCCCCCYVGPIIGIVFSLIGWAQIRANPNRYSTSDALPKIGLAISIVMLILHIIGSFADSLISKNLPRVPFNF